MNALKRFLCFIGLHRYVIYTNSKEDRFIMVCSRCGHDALKNFIYVIYTNSKEDRFIIRIDEECE